MTATAERVFREALSLTPDERALLVEQLLGGLDSCERQRLDAAWAVEAEARIDAYHAGQMTAAPAAQVMSRFKQR